MKSSISILLPDLRGGGAERVSIDLAHEFARTGHEVEFVLMRARGELLKEAQKNFSVVDLGTPRIRNVPAALARHLRARRPDALLAAMWPLTAAAGFGLILSGHKARLVGSEHVDFRVSPSLNRYERLALKYFGKILYAPFYRIVGVSAGVCESLIEVASLSEDKLQVIYNPVRQTTPEAMPTDDSILLSGWLNAEARVISIGTLKEQKGYDVLLRAFAEVRKQTNAKLLVLGEGSLRQSLCELAAQLRIQDSVWLPGFRLNPATYLQHSSCFVLSSHWEGFGNVVVEALQSGVPVISTDCPSGPSEILSEGRYGTLVRPGDHMGLADAILSTLKSDTNVEELKKRALDFNPKEKAEDYLRLLVR